MLNRMKCRKCVTITTHKKDTDEYKLPFVQCMSCSVITWLPKKITDYLIHEGYAENTDMAGNIIMGMSEQWYEQILND